MKWIRVWIFFTLFLFVFKILYHAHIKRDVLLLLRVRVYIGIPVFFFERRRRGGRGRPSGEAGASGGASDERGLCVLFFLLLVLFEEFSSFFFPRCVYVLNSLSLTLSPIGRGLWTITQTARNAFKRRVSTVHVVPVQKFMVQEVTSHSREFQAVLFLRGIERFRGVCFSGFSIEMVDRKSSAKVVGTRR